MLMLMLRCVAKKTEALRVTRQKSPKEDHMKLLQYDSQCSVSYTGKVFNIQILMTENRKIYCL